MTILDNIKLVLSNEKYEDTKLKILEETKKQFLGAVSQKDMSKLLSRSEGQTEWDRRKGQANVKNGKIGDFDFSYAFKRYEVSALEAVQVEGDPPRGSPAGPPGPPPLPPHPHHQEPGRGW